MEVITFESKAFHEIVKKLDIIIDHVAKSQSGNFNEKNKQIWLDSNEVAELLNISLRTLQRLRNEKLISYTMLRGKCLYRLSDLEKSLQERIIPTDQRTLDKFRQKYNFNNSH